MIVKPEFLLSVKDTGFQESIMKFMFPQKTLSTPISLALIRTQLIINPSNNRYVEVINLFKSLMLMVKSSEEYRLLGMLIGHISNQLPEIAKNDNNDLDDDFPVFENYFKTTARLNLESVNKNVISKRILPENELSAMKLNLHNTEQSSLLTRSDHKYDEILILLLRLTDTPKYKRSVYKFTTDTENML